MRKNNFLSKKHWLYFLTGVYFLANIYGCGVNKGKRLSISVPCSIFSAFCEILDNYKKDHPDVKVSFDNGNTVVLMRKVLHKGARPDVYIATGPMELEPLVKKGLIDEATITPISSDSIILVAHPTNPKNIRAISDLSGPNIRSIGIPDPAINSSGKYAVEALKKLNLWEAVKSKVTFTEFGRHTRNYIMKNKIDAGIIYKSCLYEDLKAYEPVIIPKEIFAVADILKETNDKISTSICILKSSKHKELAQEFIDYMLSEKSRGILKKWEGAEIKNS